LALASLDTPPPREIVVPAAMDFPKPYPFFIGAWCSPPTSTTDPKVWRGFARTGLEVAMRPLEDPNDRARNLVTLRLLDSLDDPPVRLFARDDAVHPDEATRLGWRERVDEVVSAYSGHRSLAGYFLADEPKPAEIDRVAQVAAAFADADPVHPAYVNLLPTFENSSVATQERWRADAIRLIRRGKLDLWSFSAYSQRRWGEDATFLLTLQNAARVAQETGVPFAAVLQFTGFGPLDPLPPAQLDYLAAEAIVHGARGLIWFTYWTPNPHEKGMEWRGGAVEYDGTRSPRADILRAVNEHARALQSRVPRQPRSIAHFGGAWPKGSTLANRRIRGLLGAEGGPMTIAAIGRSSERGFVLINRDRAQARTLTLRFAPDFQVNGVYRPAAPDSDWRANPDSASHIARIELPAGGSAILSVHECGR
jgi:hypothetical protein